MATALRTTSNDTLKFECGTPERVAFKFTTGKNCPGMYGERVMFSLTDGRKAFVDAEDGSDIERTLSELRIEAGELVNITKIRHPRGGGHSFRVERVETTNRPAPPPVSRSAASRIESDLERSVELARTHGAKAFMREQAVPPLPPAPEELAAPPNPTMGRLLQGALVASIDAYLIAAEYAKSKGIVVDMRFDITGEDIRQSSTAMLIEYWRSAGTR